MEKSKVLKELRSIAQEVTECPIGEEYEPFNEVAIDHICADSLDRITMITKCEEHFNISISDYDAYFIYSFEELANLICGSIKAKEKTADKI